ncbi:uncharacterized protein LOC106085017 [Stomoxys calcitrans]|uniref:uncharacterized protein LOC106085017 n=1 Tax=Stomoxys calcitrans TaxID=35570 RepID=UPI0027E24B60|nr:uncharacterized protein LOC106085017 [Stomoxys calcitrans]
MHAMSPLMEYTLESVHPVDSLRLILSIVWIIKNDFANHTISPVTLGQYAISSSGRRYQGDLIDEVLGRVQTDNAIIRYQVEGEHYPKDMTEENMTDDELWERFYHTYANREKSIWFLDSMEAFKKLERDLLDPKFHYHRNGYFLLIYTGTEAERLANLKEIFRRLFNIYVINVQVMLMMGNAPFLYTYFPFTPNHCHSSQPEFFASFEGIRFDNVGNFTLNRKLFPVKVTNMHGCDVKIATWTFMPYMSVHKDPQTNEYRLGGIEGTLIGLLSNLMNFTIIVTAPDPKEWGDIYPNKTATGAIKMIIEEEVNITVLSYTHNKVSGIAMSPSLSYLSLPFYLAIPAGSPMSPLERLMKPFHLVTWICLGFIFLSGTVLIYYIRYMGKSQHMDFVYGRGNRIPFTNFIATLFGGPVYGKVPYRNFARFILVVWIWNTTVLRTAYTSVLFTILQDSNVRSCMTSFKDVVERNYTIYTFPELLQILEMLDPKPKTRLIEGANRVSEMFAKISDPNDNDKVAMCNLEYTIRWYNQLHPHRRVQILQQPLLTAPIVFFMPRHSYVRFQLNELISKILEAGIMQRYASMYLYTTLGTRAQGEPSPLSFKLLLGIFVVYAVLIILAFFAFISELCTRKSVRIRNIVNFVDM